MNMSRMKGAVAVAAAVLALGACGDILTVADPGRYTGTDLDDALPAVANGVEGAIHEVFDRWVIDQALLADVYQHTGTWSGYDDPDHGRTNYNNNATGGRAELVAEGPVVRGGRRGTLQARHGRCRGGEQPADRTGQAWRGGSRTCSSA